MLVTKSKRLKTYGFKPLKLIYHVVLSITTTVIRHTANPIIAPI